MSTVRQRLAFSSSTVEWGYLAALVLAQIDILLTWRVAVHGPAVETGVGASAIIATHGPAAWALVLLSGVTVVFLGIRWMHEGVSKGWAKIATGYVLGFLMYNVLTNLVIAMRVGAL